jgi:hypothetical protein
VVLNSRRRELPVYKSTFAIMSQEVNSFTVCVLLFGDHVELAHRCLNSICQAYDPRYLKSLRIGMNQVCSETRDMVQLLPEVLPDTQILLYDAGDNNRLKYPMMRKMLHDPAYPVITPYVMWFDDDSYLEDGLGSAWWQQLTELMRTSDMLGSLYRFPLSPAQAQAIVKQPWYNGKPPMSRFLFATGGWWVIRTRIIQQFDYPFMDIVHNGGDTTLGELLRQQEKRLLQFRTGVRVNADEEGRESKAVRRGHHRPPVWSDWPNPVDHSCHDFEITTRVLREPAGTHLRRNPT